MSSTHLLVRLRPVNPNQPGRRNYTLLKRPGIPNTTKFSEQVGWSKVPAAIAEVLRHEQDLAGNAVFDVLTQAEAVALEYAEAERAAKKLIHHKAASPNVMHFQTSKSAADFAPDVPAPRVKPTAAKVEMQGGTMRVSAPVVTPAEIDWDSVGDSAPADDAADEADDEPVSFEAVGSMTAPAEDTAVETEAPRRKGGGRKGK